MSKFTLTASAEWRVSHFFFHKLFFYFYALVVSRLEIDKGFLEVVSRKLYKLKSADDIRTCVLDLSRFI